MGKGLNDEGKSSIGFIIVLDCFFLQCTNLGPHFCILPMQFLNFRGTRSLSLRLEQLSFKLIAI